MNILNFLDSLKGLSTSKSEWREESPQPESPAMRMIRKQAQDQGMTVDDFVRYYQSPEYTSEYDQPAARPMIEQPGVPMQGQQPQTNQAELEARWQKMLADRPNNEEISSAQLIQSLKQRERYR